MNRLIPDPDNSGKMLAYDESGELIARGYLAIDFIPPGGGAVVNGISFVTDPVGPTQSDRERLHLEALSYGV